MLKNKLKKEHFLVILQLTLQVACFVWGFTYKSDVVTLQPSFLSTMSRIQTTKSLQNFLWCFSNNICILYVTFWLNYFTYGVVGTIVAFNSVFALGAISRVALALSWFHYLSFVLIEFLNALIIAASSTYFAYMRNRKTNYLHDNDFEIEKKARQKSILKILCFVAILATIAALIETIVLQQI